MVLNLRKSLKFLLFHVKNPKRFIIVKYHFFKKFTIFLTSYFPHNSKRVGFPANKKNLQYRTIYSLLFSGSKHVSFRYTLTLILIVTNKHVDYAFWRSIPELF